MQPSSLKAKSRRYEMNTRENGFKSQNRQTKRLLTQMGVGGKIKISYPS
jgi:hypothetical protein